MNHEYFKYDTNIKMNNTEVCFNWWPVSKNVCIDTDEKLPHPLCKVCANWLPDIEDLVKNPSTTKHSKCINEWSKSKS